MAFISAGIEKLTGYPAAAFTARSSMTFASIIHPDDRELVSCQVGRALKQGQSYQLTYRLVAADGAIKWVWEQGGAVPGAGGGIEAIQGFICDFTRVKMADRKVLEQASLLDKALDAIFVIDADSRITYWNHGAERLYGWDADEIEGQRLCDLVYDDPAEYRIAYCTTLSEGEWRGELTQRRRDGSRIHVDSRWTLVDTDSSASEPSGRIMSINTDVSERKQHEDKIFRLAFYDPLTELPNRANLLDHLRRALLGSARSGKYGALMFCDLDHFKRLNDTHGHAAGDMLLQAAARRLEQSVREADMVARLGGDEFVILIAPQDDTRDAAALQAETVATKIVTAMSAPFKMADFSYAVSASIGMVLISGSTDTVESALKQADSAMYQAKASGRNTFHFYDPEMQAALFARAELETGLQRALRNNEFVLYYQPQMDGNNHVIGAEALLRWRLPSGELRLPADFIHTAEETDLIVDIGMWVLETACQQLALWQRADETAHLSLSVNVSARQFVEPDLVAKTEAILRQTGADPRGLKFELTESLVVTDFVQTAQQMKALRKLGISFSLDDFGTGYSSLVCLRNLPIDQLKIDHSFMRGVLTDRNDAAIVRSIIALSGSLGLQVIAEGVETIGQRQFLSDAGCHAYQGFLYERAIAEEHFSRYARQKH
ncbi:EAL domain-containing protein [Massilia sp. RP-1-19]|uniref:EAL domain-containing protein n=2 Tax=Massilia polaris TaxID=2728846 RepID=A0A848HDH6_9BURK|nr:EAL domain-containing protein [Massilia polaris]